MSAFFKIKLADKTIVTAEVARNGNIYFPNYDFEYDLSMEEFGEKATIPLQIVRAWTGDWQDIVYSYFGLTRMEILDLVMDMAKYSYKLFSNIQDWHSENLKKVLDLVENYMAGQMPEKEFKIRRRFLGIKKPRHWYKRRYYRRYAPSERRPSSAQMVYNERLAVYAQTATHLLDITVEAMKKTKHYKSSKFASLFIRTTDMLANLGVHGFVVGAAPNSDELKFYGGFSRRQESILRWQRRRFAHVMEAKQRGLPKPPLEATK